MGSKREDFWILIRVPEGIGREIVKAFAQSGCQNIAILDRNYAEAKLTCEAVSQEVVISGQRGAKIQAYECDVTQESSTKRAFDDAVRESKGVHILAAVAGWDFDGIYLDLGVDSGCRDL